MKTLIRACGIAASLSNKHDPRAEAAASVARRFWSHFISTGDPTLRKTVNALFALYCDTCAGDDLASISWALATAMVLDRLGTSDLRLRDDARAIKDAVAVFPSHTFDAAVQITEWHIFHKLLDVECESRRGAKQTTNQGER